MRNTLSSYGGAVPSIDPVPLDLPPGTPWEPERPAVVPPDRPTDVDPGTPSPAPPAPAFRDPPGIGRYVAFGNGADAERMTQTATATVTTGDGDEVQVLTLTMQRGDVSYERRVIAASWREWATREAASGRQVTEGDAP